MNSHTLLFRLLFKAAWVRKDRALTALISVGVVATIATAALTVYSNLEGTLGREFRSFGANVIVTQGSGALTSGELADMNKVVGSRGEVVPVAYAIGTEARSGAKVVVGGTDLGKLRKLNSAWSYTQWASENNLIGSRVEETLAHEKSLQISFGHSTSTIESGVVFHSGSDDDSRIYLPLEDFERLTGVRPNAAMIRVEGRPKEIQAAIAALSSALPHAEVEPVRRITQTQTAVVGKTRAVVLASSIIVVVLIMLSMAATFTSSVLERRKDFAVMKALGASNRTVNFMFAAEAAFLAIAGSAAGFLLGSGIAFWIGKVNFDAAILPQPALLLPVLLGSVALALVASTAPLRLLQRIQPAGILRGE
jgi:putative ABC transport system permease protein